MSPRDRIESAKSELDNFGPPTPVGVTIDLISGAKYAIVEAAGYKAISFIGSTATSIAIGSANVVDAALNGDAVDVTVETAGVGGGVVGGFLAGAGTGLLFAGETVNPIVVAIATIIGGAYGSVYGANEVKRVVRELLTQTPTDVEQMRTDAEYLASDPRDGDARDTEGFEEVGGIMGLDNTHTYTHQDRLSGAQVNTTVVQNPVTGQKRAIYSTLIDPNQKYALLKGNTYPPGHVQVGYELNALDRISEERNVWSNTPDPKTTGAQGNGLGPSDPQDPRGIWQDGGGSGVTSGGSQLSGGEGGRPTMDMDPPAALPGLPEAGEALLPAGRHRKRPTRLVARRRQRLRSRAAAGAGPTLAKQQIRKMTTPRPRVAVPSSSTSTTMG